MKAKILFLFTCFFTLLLSAQERPIATNLTSVHDYSTELVFTDAFKQSREWISFQADGNGPWDTQVAVPLSEQGYPLEIPYDDGVNPPQSVRALLLWDINEALPLGQYRLLVEGSGTVSLRFGASGVFQCPVDTMVTVTSGVSVEIEASSVEDPITDIKFIYPDYVDTYEEQVFTNELLTFLDDFQAIRFMDWLRTNNSNVTSWSGRSRYDYFTQSTAKGVAWEYVVELANLLEKDVWINIPHQANDDYLQQLANFLLANLDTDLNIYLEYSNEVWNSQFDQHHYAAEQGLILGYPEASWDRAWQYTAKRSADIFRVFTDTFGGADRLIRIIPTQAANAWVTNRIMEYFNAPMYNPTQVAVDAIAIAPYFGGTDVANTIVSQGEIATISIAEIVARMEATLPVSFGYMEDNQVVADEFDLDLIAYEGGQHLVATGANVNIDELTVKLNAANHHPDLQAAYCQYFDYWYTNHGGLFAHFSSHGSYSKWGSWGVKETMEDVNNPKYLGLQECVFAYNDIGTALGELEEPLSSLHAFPNPTNTGEITVSGNFDDPEIRLFDALGRQVDYKQISLKEDQLRLQLPKPGLYFVHIREAGSAQGLKVIYQ
ncbi:T9SS type A sorting domain-containing protein [Lewinella cohaerens]|uniref:T9SS type A sorting domain-containing protein n=1 Tax=Lewinella cohaerens TaxID=70995 RepID=UPI00035C2967|nr:T9SS type A sorting domain-containing protein [Lewinella cohaerens]